MIGKRFSRLVVLSECSYRMVKSNGKKARLWHCQCDCGEITQVATADLNSGNVKSCSCLQSEMRVAHGKLNAKHGDYKGGHYKRWQSMRERCGNKNAPNYHLYGGRGISVCKDWDHSGGYVQFREFIESLGERPDGWTLDRIDVNGDYEAGNLRWASSKTQQANRRINQ